MYKVFAVCSVCLSIILYIISCIFLYPHSATFYAILIAISAHYALSLLEVILYIPLGREPISSAFNGNWSSLSAGLLLCVSQLPYHHFKLPILPSIELFLLNFALCVLFKANWQSSLMGAEAGRVRGSGRGGRGRQVNVGMPQGHENRSYAGWRQQYPSLYTVLYIPMFCQVYWKICADR